MTTDNIFVFLYRAEFNTFGYKMEGGRRQRNQR